MDRLGGGISSALREREEGRKCVGLDAFSFPLAKVCATRRSLSHPSTLLHLALLRYFIGYFRVQILQLGMWGFIQRSEEKASIAGVCKVGWICSGNQGEASSVRRAQGYSVPGARTIWALSQLGVETAGEEQATGRFRRWAAPRGPGGRVTFVSITVFPLPPWIY